MTRMAPHFMTILTGRDLPRIRQARAPEPSIIKRKDDRGLHARGREGAFWTVSPDRPRKTPDGQRATSAQASGERGVIQPVPGLFVGPTGNSVALGDSNTLDRAEVALGPFVWGRAEGRDGAKQKRRCYQRRSGAPTRGTGPLRLALAGATRSGSAGVGSHGSRSAGEATPHSSGVNWNDN